LEWYFWIYYYEGKQEKNKAMMSRELKLQRLHALEWFPLSTSRLGGLRLSTRRVSVSPDEFLRVLLA
jgi:hypothetical protein